MIQALQLNNNTFKLGLFTPVGLYAQILLVTPGYEDLELKCSKVSISRGVDNSYSTFNFSADSVDFDILVTRIPTSEINIILYALTPIGTKVISHNFILSLSEFRYDQGPTGYSLTLVSRTTINISPSADIEVSPLFSLKRYDNPLRYSFGLNPELYALYSINTNITFNTITGVVSGPVTSFRLIFNSEQPHQLEVEITPP